MKKVIVLLAVLVLAGAGIFWYWHTSAKPAPRLQTVAVKRGDLVATINATGTIEPEEVVDVGAQVAGQIKEFGRDPRDSSRPIDYGSPVEEGTILAQIDSAMYQTQVDQAKANLEHAMADVEQYRARYAQAERDWKRARALNPPRAISQEEYDAAQAAYETAKATLAVSEASVAQARAALKQAEINLGYCTIRSPVKGSIVDRRVNVGQTVVASLNSPSLFLIAKDLKRLQVWASVNEADVGHIHSGQPVRLTVDAFPGEVFQGIVAPDQPRLNASMTQNVVTYTVVVAIDNSSGKLLPYLTANVQFEIDRHDNVLQVPSTALRWRPSPPLAAEAHAAPESSSRKARASSNEPSANENPKRGTVWVEDHGAVRPVTVDMGLSDGVHTEVSGDGLKEGDLVVVGEAQAESGSDVSNPFTPQVFGNKKQQ